MSDGRWRSNNWMIRITSTGWFGSSVTIISTKAFLINSSPSFAPLPSPFARFHRRRNKRERINGFRPPRGAPIPAAPLLGRPAQRSAALPSSPATPARSLRSSRRPSLALPSPRLLRRQGWPRPVPPRLRGRRGACSRTVRPGGGPRLHRRRCGRCVLRCGRGELEAKR